MNFIANDYEVPSTSNYFQFEEGENRFRILGGFESGEAIMGTEYWVTVDGKRKPKRVLPNVPVQVDEIELNPKTGEPDLPKHFWALPVWNYKIEKVQILEIKQKTIQNAILSYARDDDWGSPTDYDLKVIRDESTGKTTYQVKASPKKELDPAIVKQYKEMHLNMNALFDGGDPFLSSKPVDLALPKDTELDKDIKEIFDSK